MISRHKDTKTDAVAGIRNKASFPRFSRSFTIARYTWLWRLLALLLIGSWSAAVQAQNNNEYVVLDLVQVQGNSLNGAKIKITPKNITFLGAGGGCASEIEDFVHSDDWDVEKDCLSNAAKAGEIRLSATAIAKIKLQGAPAGLTIASAKLLRRELPHSHGGAAKGHRSAEITLAYTGSGINADVRVTVAVEGGGYGLLSRGNQRAGYPTASCCSASFTIKSGTIVDGANVNPVSLTLIERGGANAEATYTVGLLTDPGADVTITATVPAANTSDVDVKTGTGSFGSSATLTFTHGSSGNWTQTQTVTVRAKNDSDTADESFNITHSLSVASGPYQTITPRAVAVTVTDAGAGLPVSFSAASYRANEPASTANATLGLTLSGSRSTATTVTVERAGGTATSGQDYTAGPWTATIAANTTTGTVTIPILHDTADETNETVELRIRASSLPAGVVLGNQSTATLHITDNDATSVTLSGTGTVKEDGSNSANVKITLGRKLAGGESVTAPLVIAGSGITRKDYAIGLKSGSNQNLGVSLNTASPYSRWNPAVVFQGSDVNTVRLATLAVTGKEDTRDEGASETVTVSFGSGDKAVTSNLDRASGRGATGTTASGSASVTITDNDQPPSLVISPTKISARSFKDGGTATLTLTPKNSTFFAAEDGGDSVSQSYVFFDDRGQLGEIPRTEVRLSQLGLSQFRLSSVSSYLVISAGRLLEVQEKVHGVEQHRSIEIDLSYQGPPFTANDAVTLTVDNDILRFGDQSDDRPASQSAQFTILPVDPNTGIALRESGSPATTRVDENGTTDSYEIVLKTKPTHAVTVTVTAAAGAVVDGPDGGSVGTPTETLTFNPTGNSLWSTPQTITVTGVDDKIDNAGNARTAMISHAATSIDPNYNINDVGGVSVTITDEDTAAVTVSPTVHTIAENGGTATYTLKLDSQPLKSVKITVNAGDGSFVKVDGPDSATDFTNTETLTFTTSNWSTAQQIRIEAQDDSAVNYPHRATTITHLISGAGNGDASRYTPSMSIAGMDVTLIDDEKPELTLAKTSTNTVTEGGTATFTVTSSDPAPSGGLPITLPTLTFSNGYSGSLATNKITIPANTTTVIFDVDLDDDSVDEPDGTITVALNPGTQYKLGATFSVELDSVDNDVTSLTLEGSSAGYVIEGGTKDLTLTLSRGLLKGETLTVPLTFAGTAVRNADYKLAARPARGVAYNNLNSGSAKVVFTGPATGTTATKATITFTATSDSIIGSTTETVTIGLGALTNSGSGGGVTATDNLAGFHIVDSVEPSEPIVTLSQPDKTTLSEGGDAVEFDLLVSPPYFNQDYSVVNLEHSGKAQSGIDYQLEVVKGGTVSSRGSPLYADKGVSSIRLRVVPLSDNRNEPNESIIISVPDQLKVYRDAGSSPYTVDVPRSVKFTLTRAGAPKPKAKPIASFASAKSNPGEDIGTHNVVVNFSPAPSTAITIAYSVTGTASAGSSKDFTIQNKGTASVTAGATSANIPVTIVDDTVDDNDETVILTLTDGQGYELGTTEVHTITIDDNDSAAAPGVTVSAASLNLAEGGAAGSYTIVLQSRPTANVNVTATSSDATKVRVQGPGGSLGASATLTFTPSDWNQQQTVTVTPQDDSDAGDESVTIAHAVSNTGGYNNVTVSSVTVLVDDDETPLVPTPAISISTTSANTITEGGSATFTLTASPAPSSSITITQPTLTFSSGYSGSVAGSSITLPAGQSTVNFDVNVDNDSVDRSDGTLTVALQTGTGYTVGTTSSHALDVADNDATTVTLAGSADKVTEGSTKALTVTLGRGLVDGETLTVPLTFAGTATRNTDYTLSGSAATGVTYTSLNSGTARIKFTGPNLGTTATVATITFNATADSTSESPEESVDIGLGTLVQTSLSGGITETDNLASFNIADPAPLPEIIVTGGAAVTEGTAASFTVSATPNPSASLTVNLNVTQSGQFVASSGLGTKTVTVGTTGTATYTVDTVGDQVNEADGSVTVTVGSGSGYTVGNPSAATVAISDDDIAPSTCVSAKLLQSVEDYYDHNKDSAPGYGHNWFRVLVAFGARSPSNWTADNRTITPMTAADAQQREQYWFGWGPIAEALECLEGVNPDPVITISGANPITEGGSATFTLTASPTPQSQLTVNVNVVDSGNFADSGQAGTRTVTVGTGGSGTLTVSTDNDHTDEPDGTLTATVTDGTGYTLGTTSSSALDVTDNDATTVTLAGSAGKVTEGSSKTFTLTLSRGLIQGETLTAPLTFAGTATRNTDYTLSGTAATGVTYTSLNSGTARIKFTGPNLGTTATVATVTFNATTDSTSESPEESVDIGLGTPVPTGLSGGTTKIDNLSSFNIEEPAPLPSITVTGGAAVTEGAAASFTVSATPNPSSSLTVNLNVTQSGQFVASADRGTKTVTVGTTGTATYTVDTVGDQVNEADGSVTVTVGSGSGYTVGNPSAASVAVSDDDIAPSTCVSDTLVQKVEDYYDHNKTKSPGYGHNWFRVLVAFGARSPSDWTTDSRAMTPMTAAEATEREQNWFGWGPVAEALDCLDEVSPIAAPVVSISGGDAITEGGTASFILTASPTPSSTITVNVNVVDSDSFADSGQTGTRTVSIGTDGTATLTVTTDDDSTDEPDGTLTATVTSGTGYTPSGTNASASVTVNDNDDPPPATPVVSISGGSAITEGGSASFTLTASPVPQSQITVNVNVADSDSFADSGQTGTRTVIIGTDGTATLTVTTDDDSIDEPDGTLTVTVQSGQGYSVSDTNASYSIAVNDNDGPPAVTPEVTITAGAKVTEGTAATFTVTATPVPTAPLDVTLTIDQSGDFTASGETGSRTVTVPVSGSVDVEVVTVDDAGDEPDGSITATVDTGTGYTVAAPPDNAAQVAVSDNDAAAGPTISIADATFTENERYGYFTVTLSEKTDHDVRFAYATRDSTPVSATANADYVEIPRAWTIGSRVKAGKTQARFWIPIRNDSHDEDPETFEVELFDAFIYRSGKKVEVSIADGVAVGTITNSDPMPAAWLSRFGRTAAEQALDSIAGRIAASRSAGIQGAVAGQSLILDSESKLPTHDIGSDVARAFSNGSTTLSNDGLSQIAFDPGAVSNPAFNTEDRTPQSYSMTAQELLVGSSFTATEDTDSSGGSLAFWGHMAQSSFDGQEGTFSLDGKTNTAMVGTDYARGELLLGMALMYSKGKGSYADTETDPRPKAQTCPKGEEGKVPCGEAVRAGDSKVEASLTSVVPYGAIQASERFKVWGAFGHGTGEVTLKPQVGGSLSSDLSWTMAAGGLRGDLIAPPSDGNGFALAVTSDALWARTTSEKTHELAASDSDITRLRVGLQGSWHMALAGDGSITPKFELGLRQDGGDAETGFGIELGGGVTWMDPALGMSLDLSGRTLITHDSDDLKDRGFGASLTWDPKPATARGPSIRMNWDWGGQATGGLDSLFTPQTLERRTGTDSTTARWRAEAAYGIPVLGGRFIGSPHMGLGLATGSRDYSLGWRVTPQSSAPDLSFGLSAMRTESDSVAPEHAVRFEAIFRW